MNTRYKYLFALLLVLLVSASAAKAQVKLTWQVVKYEIDCTLPSDFAADRKMKVRANLTIRNQSGGPYNRVTLRLSDQAKVESVAAGGSAIDFRTGEEKITETQKLQRVILRIPSVASGSTTRIGLEYGLTVKENTGLSALSPISSQFLPFSFWYPTPTSWYFTEGSDFAPVDISVKNLGSRQLVAAGSESSGSFSNKLNGMPFFVTGKWKVSDHDGISVYAPANDNTSQERSAEMAALASKAKKYIEGRFGKTIDVPIRIVAASRGAGFTDSGTVFVEPGAFYSRMLDSKTAVTIVEAVAKTMVGNVIEVRGGGWGVVREGLSRFLSNELIESVYGKEVAEVVRLRQLSSYAAISDKDGPLNVISPVDGYFYSATGNKGAMVWNFLRHKYSEDFFALLKATADDGELTLSELRNAFKGQQSYLDHALEKVTTMNLLIGLPQRSGSTTKAALRNMGEIDVETTVVAVDSEGKKMEQRVSIPANDFSEARFESATRITEVEVDPGKLYAQTAYNDDIAPRRISENDPLVFIKKEFDRQKYDAAEENARIVLARRSEFDDARVLLARALLAKGSLGEAKAEFERVLSQKLASPQSIGWSVHGLGEIARRNGQTDIARRHFDEAIRGNTEYGTTLAARRGRAMLGGNASGSEEIKAFFAEFDSAITANSKKAVESLLLSGEISRFASNVAGQAQAWQTAVVAVDEIDDENLLVETNLTIKLLNRENESGLAVFRLSRMDGKLRISGVEIFEVG